MPIAWAGRRHRGWPHCDPAAGGANLRTMTGRRAMSHLPAQVAGSVIYAEGLTRYFGSVTALKLAPVAVDELGESLVVALSGKGHQVGCGVAAQPTCAWLSLASVMLLAGDSRVSSHPDQPAHSAMEAGATLITA